jgi:hypothetical protein
MIRFLDGPAKRVHSLFIARAPLFLRVVYSDKSKGWDCLDQIEDKPEPDETVYAYRREGKPGTVIACTRSKKRGCQTFRSARYRFFEPQPSEEIMRDNAQWQAWACAQFQATSNLTAGEKP